MGVDETLVSDGAGAIGAVPLLENPWGSGVLKIDTLGNVAIYYVLIIHNPVKYGLVTFIASVVSE